MLIVFLHGPPDELILIAFAVVAAIALLGAFIATRLYARSGGAQRNAGALAAGTVAGFALTYGFFHLSMTSLSPIFSSMSAGPLLTTITIIAFGCGFAVAASILRFAKKS